MDDLDVGAAETREMGHGWGSSGCKVTYRAVQVGVVCLHGVYQVMSFAWEEGNNLHVPCAGAM